MTKRGILKTSEDHKTRLQRTLKSMVKTWTKKYLKMDDEDWQQLQIMSIQQTNSEDSDIVFLKFFQPGGSGEAH